MEWAHRILSYPDDVNLLGDNIGIIKRNRETLFYASTEVGREVNVEKTKYMLVSRGQNAGQHREIKVGSRSFENVSQFNYLGTAVTNQNSIQEEIKRRPNSGSACYHCVRLEVFTGVTRQNGVFWDVTPCGSCKNQHFGGPECLLHQGDKICD
jgi:hypothetical protein